MKITVVQLGMPAKRGERELPQTAGLESTQPSHTEEKYQRRFWETWLSQLFDAQWPAYSWTCSSCHTLSDKSVVPTHVGEEKREPESLPFLPARSWPSYHFHQVTQALRTLALLQPIIQLNHCTCFLRVGLSLSVLLLWHSDTFLGNVFEGDKWTNAHIGLEWSIVSFC